MQIQSVKFLPSPNNDHNGRGRLDSVKVMGRDFKVSLPKSTSLRANTSNSLMDYGR